MSSTVKTKSLGEEYNLGIFFCTVFAPRN